MEHEPLGRGRALALVPALPLLALPLALPLPLALAACGSSSSAGGDEASPASTPEPVPTPTAPDTAECDASAGPVPVSLPTEDDLTLEADYYPAGSVGGPAVVLLHMIPPSNDKSNFPASFIEALHAAGYSVLNVNRRGAGGSQGEPTQAYEGPNGRLDAVAAHAFVTGSGCRAPAHNVALVGGSNGTTTALDFTVQAPAEHRPPAMVWLSPGSYTENQHAVADHAAVLAPIPLLMGFPPGEREWPEGIREHDTGAWEWHEYADGKHGTGLFQTHPQIEAEIVEFLGRHRAG